MNKVLIELSADDVAMHTKAFSALMNSEQMANMCETCRDEAVAKLDLYLQMLDDMMEEALQDKIEEEIVRKYGEA